MLYLTIVKKFRQKKGANIDSYPSDLLFYNRIIAQNKKN